ncbi:MAG: hypothetical protein WCR54_00460 [Clostridia bacterium]
MKNKNKIISLILVLVCVLSVCLLSSCEKDSSKYYVEEDSRYSFDLLKSTVMDVPFVFALNSTESFVQLNSDKTIQISVMANNGITAKIKDFIDINAALDGINIERDFNAYAPELIPGASLDDLDTTAKLLCSSLDITLTGLGFANEQTEELSKILKKEIPFPDDYKIPDDLGFKYNGTYYIEDVQTDSGIVKGVYIGDHDSDSDSFLIMTLYEEKKGENTIQKLMFRVEFLQLYVRMTKTEIK